MRLQNPRFVPREWMLVEAYDAAAAGDFGPVEKLLDLFSKPYEEPSATAACTAAAATASSEDDADGRFFRREVALEKKPGVAFMT